MFIIKHSNHLIQPSNNCYIVFQYPTQWNKYICSLSLLISLLGILFPSSALHCRKKDSNILIPSRSNLQKTTWFSRFKKNQVHNGWRILNLSNLYVYLQLSLSCNFDIISSTTLIWLIIHWLIVGNGEKTWEMQSMNIRMEAWM